nr:type I-U CRISPR-associated protein Csb2 [uncultured Corynebacterium sp.]
MSITCSVTFIAGIYSGNSPGEAPFPPSPGRLISAFISEIGRRSDPAAKDLVRRLCASGDPTIIAPQSYSSGSGESYMQPLISSSPDSGAPRELFAGPQRILGERGGKIRKCVNGHRLVTGALHYIWEDAALTPDDVAVLNDIAGEIPYLGRECDLARVQVTNSTLTEMLDSTYRSSVTPPTTLRPSPHGTHRFRAATPAFLQWLDDRYASLFAENADQPIPVDHRVTVTRYAPSVPTPRGGQWLEIMAFRRPRSLASALEVARDVVPGDNGVVFPVTRSGHRELDGRAVGLGILTSTGTALTDNFDTKILGEDTGLRSLSPDYWVRRSQRWMTAVPFLAHPDKWVASRQAATALPDAVLTGISPAPLRPSQARLGSDDDHRAWHLTLTTSRPVHGPLILDKEHGTGVLMPDYLNDSEEKA